VIIADMEAILVFRRKATPGNAVADAVSSVTSIIEILNAFQKQKDAPKFSTATPSRLYFCLDTSLNRTLAYAHWCNWGECPGAHS
jgi:hypothetical protein